MIRIRSSQRSIVRIHLATEGTSTLALLSFIALARQLMAGTVFTDPDFSTNYIDATKAGIIQGGYHSAHPDISEGGTQANFFLVSTYNRGNVDAPLRLGLFRWVVRRRNDATWSGRSRRFVTLAYLF